MGRRLHTECPFDGTYHATYSAYWLPTPASRFGIPCVWGPVGGAVTTPLALWRFLGWAGVLGEILDMVAVRIVSWWPGTRRTWWTAKERIVQNEETLQRLPEPLREHCHILNHVLFAVAPTIQTRPRKTHVLSIAPLDARKGLRLLIHAMAHTRADIHLIVVGDGPDRNALQRLTRRLRLTQRIEFLGHVPREELFELLAEAAAVVFTGLREEGGMGLAEAMLAGAPVIVLANGGARTIAALGTDPDRARLIQPATAEETVHRVAEAMTDFSRNPPASTGPTLDQKAARKAFEEIFRNALVSHLAEC